LYNFESKGADGVLSNSRRATFCPILVKISNVRLDKNSLGNTENVRRLLRRRKTQKQEEIRAAGAIGNDH
jgi:hypothetical protein